MFHRFIALALIILSLAAGREVYAVTADGPSVILNSEEITRLRKEIKTIPWKREKYEKDTGDEGIFLGGGSIKPIADKWLSRQIEIPARSGHFHNFFCDDGVRLTLPADDMPSPDGYKCPACGKVYKGERYDACVRWRTHNKLAVAAFCLAFTYAIEDDKRYASKAAEILTKYADAYPGPHTSATAGGIMYQSLCESVWSIPLAVAYDLIRNSAALSDAEKTKIEAKLLKPVAKGLMDVKVGGNWLSWHLSAVGVIGYAMRDQVMIDYAVNAFKYQIENNLGDDGLWPESVHTYHFYPLNAFLYLTEAAWHNGTDLYNWEAKPGKSLRAMFTAPLRYMYPDFRLPAINDGWFNAFLPAAQYELAYARLRDPEIGWALKTWYRDHGGQRAGLWALLCGKSLEDDFPAPDLRSINFPVLGIAILRSPDGSMMTFDYGPHLGHGQLDKMGITLFANGKLLSADYGTSGYGSAMYAWQRSTPAHNTVVVDGRSQSPTRERRLTLFGTGEHFEAAEAETSEAYPGVLHRRTVLRIDDYFVVLDKLESEEEHTYDWFLRCEGDLVVEMPLSRQPSPKLSYDRVEEKSRYSPESTWSVRWRQTGGGLGLLMLDDLPSTVYSTVCPADTGARKVPLIIARRNGKSASFTSLLYPYQGRMRVTARLENGVLHVNHDGVTDSISLESSPAGRFALVRSDSNGVVFASTIVSD